MTNMYSCGPVSAKWADACCLKLILSSAREPDGEKLIGSRQKFMRGQADIYNRVGVTAYCSIIVMSNHDMIFRGVCLECLYHGC